MRTIPRKDADFDLVQNAITAIALTNVTQWQLDANWINTQFVPAKTKWTSAWNAYQHLPNRTMLITFTKNEARRKYEPLLRILVNNLKVNTKVSNDERAQMCIKIDSSSRTLMPIPIHSPGAYLELMEHGIVIIHFRSFEKKGKGKPYGVHGAEISWALLEYPPVNLSDLTNTSFKTRPPLTLTFDYSKRGQTLYFAMAWVNTRGEKGPWSRIMNVIVP
jgi:hypothetical protein